MNKSLLLEALNDVVAILPPSSLSQDLFSLDLSRLLYQGEHEPSKSDPHIVALIEQLCSNPEFEIFNGCMQVVANQAIRFEYHNLAGWLIGRAMKTSSEQAIEDIEKYLSSADIPFRMTLAVGGCDRAIPNLRVA
jgi:hypothetical protein